MGTATVVVVEDDQYIRELVSSGLRIAGFDVRSATSGHEALQVVERDAPDLVVLDVGLPGLDGFEVCRRLRDRGDDVPILFLTAHDSAEDRLSGFTRGGDDYVTKPFSLEELVARVQAILRRASLAATVANRLCYEDLELDEDSLLVTRSGRTIRLSRTEFKLLRYLLVNRERVLSKSQILNSVWDYDFDGTASIVENYISYLRKKVDNVDPPLIHTVRGFGYVLRREP